MSLLQPGLFSSRGKWALLCCGVQASHCGDFSCGAQALGHVGFSGIKPASHRVSSRSCLTLEDRFSSCWTWASLLHGMWGVFPDQG